MRPLTNTSGIMSHVGARRGDLPTYDVSVRPRVRRGAAAATPRRIVHCLRTPTIEFLKMRGTAAPFFLGSAEHRHAGCQYYAGLDATDWCDPGAANGLKALDEWQPRAGW